jgi:hypothetical protein
MKPASGKMKIAYRNRKGDTFYLHVGKTKKGNDKYFFSQKQGESLAYELPAGYEIYENPDGQVFLRKITPRIITLAEERLVENGIKRYSKAKHFKIELRKEKLIIHMAEDVVEDFSHNLPILLSLLADPRLGQKLLVYMPMLLFELIDKEQRLFLAQRNCFRGGIDDWIPLEEGTLDRLVKKFVRHLGRKSFFELI